MTKIDREIQEELYSVKKRHAWNKNKTFHRWGKVAAHKRRVHDPAKVKHSLARPPKRWFYAMVKGVKRSSPDVRKPEAVVSAIWKRLSPTKRKDIKHREEKGERFKYDLPLPDDRTTHGRGTVRMVKPFKLAEVQVNLSKKDYHDALKSGLFSRMKRRDGTTALVARCKSPVKNVNVFIDKV